MKTDLAPFVRILGRGPGRSRSLTRDEAFDAMRLILNDQAAPEATGALLMLMRMRGETADEVAGFAEALRAALPNWPGPRPGLDWPSYAAGRTRGAPWFLLSARLVARAGVPVLLHGWNSHQNPVADVRQALTAAGIPLAATLSDAADQIANRGIAYLPLEEISPKALALLKLRNVLGLRSAVNTVCRVMNPGQAAASVQGVFHPPYRALQQDACALMGLRNMSVIKGGGGEFERHPDKDIQLFGLTDGTAFDRRVPALTEGHRRLAEAAPAHGPDALARLWAADNATETDEIDDPFARDVVIGTAALALECAGRAAQGKGRDLAETLWAARHDGHDAPIPA